MIALLLLLAPLPATLAQSKTDLPAVSNFRFTADNAFAWDAPSSTVGVKEFYLDVSYVVITSNNKIRNYGTTRRLSTSTTSATVTYNTSAGTWACATANIRLLSSDKTSFNDGPWTAVTRGSCDPPETAQSNLDEEAGTPRAHNVGDGPSGNGGGSGPSGSGGGNNGGFSASSAGGRNRLARSSVRDGMVLPWDGRLNLHAAAPVAAYAGTDSLNFWHVLSNSEGVSLGSIPDINALAESGNAGGELLRSTHPESGKIVTVTYRSQFQMVEVSTFYADTPNQANKLYTFCIMADNSVETVLW